MLQLLASVKEHVYQGSGKPVTVAKCSSHSESVDGIASGGIEPFGVAAERNADKDTRYHSRHDI